MISIVANYKNSMGKRVLIISSSPHKGGNGDKRYDALANKRGSRL